MKQDKKFNNKSELGKNMINFYTLDSVKKYVKNQGDDKQYKFTGMKNGKHILSVGSTGSGKTNSLLNYLKLTSIEPTFDAVFLCYITDEELYDYLEGEYNKIFMYKGFNNFPNVDDFPDTAHSKQPKKFLMIFDDIVNEQTNKMAKKKIDDWFKIGRKKGFTIFYMSQSYYLTPKFIRLQCSYVLLQGSLKGRDLNDILKDCGISTDIDKNKLLRIFEYCTTPDKLNDMPMLKICKLPCPANEKFSRNFIDYINTTNF